MKEIHLKGLVVFLFIWCTALTLLLLGMAQAPGGLEQAKINVIQEAAGSVVGVHIYEGGFLLGSGSGVIYKTEGGSSYIVTNNHVVEGGAAFEVVTLNNSSFEAQLLGTDPYTDLALLRVEGFYVGEALPFGHTEELRLGQTVIAIGNPLGIEFAGTITSGIVSGHNRMITHMAGYGQLWEVPALQSDVTLNPGNSGGALINLAGEVVGINTWKFIGEDIDGMSFSIPTYVVLPVIADLEAYGFVQR